MLEVAVIGRGMIGSAVARHLAEGGTSVAVIGGPEPADYQEPNGQPFASHYDHARITRFSASDEIWADLSARSIARYDDIATRSGTQIHKPTGLVTASSNAARAVELACQRGGNARQVDRNWVRTNTGITLADTPDTTVLFEDAPAGVIFPRALVDAQTTLAIRAGAIAVNFASTSIARTANGFEVTAGTETVRARKVVIATGAYGAGIVGVDLAIERRLRTVLHVELDQPRELPCLIVEHPESSQLDRLYWTPPIRYPNGRSMLKLGASVLPLERAESARDIANWFAAGGSAAEAQALLEALSHLLPDTAIVSSEHQPCVMAYTTTERPFIGQVDDDVVVALGGNGSGAKGSDEMGRLAAVAITGGDDVLLHSLGPQLR